MELKEYLKTARKIRQNLQLEPVGDAIIVYRMKLEATAGGIVLPEKRGLTSDGYAVTAVVVAKGPGKYSEFTGGLIPMPVVDDDVILITAMSGLELGEIARRELGDGDSFEELRLISSKDVIAKVNH